MKEIYQRVLLDSSILWERYFQATLKAIPWMALVSSLVCRPRRNSPEIPSFATICAIVYLYVSLSIEVCLNVFTTLIELLRQSDTTVQAKPMPALLTMALTN